MSSGSIKSCQAGVRKSGVSMNHETHHVYQEWSFWITKAKGSSLVLPWVNNAETVVAKAQNHGICRDVCWPEASLGGWSGQGQVQKVGSGQGRSELHSRFLEGILVQTSKECTLGGRRRRGADQAQGRVWSAWKWEIYTAYDMGTRTQSS